jgi:hypothetical protein
MAFGPACHLQSPCLAYSSTLMMEEIGLSETSAEFQWTTRRYIPEDSMLDRLSIFMREYYFSKRILILDKIPSSFQFLSIKNDPWGQTPGEPTLQVSTVIKLESFGELPQ